MTVTVDRVVEEFTAAPRKLFIDGQWTDAASGKTFETPNPATGETLANVAEGDAEDINRAVSAARKAFESGPWSRMTPSERGRLIWKIGDLILENAEELAQLESLDNGKPVGVALVVDHLDALDEPDSLAWLRATAQAMLPRVDLPELLLEVNAWTGFLDAYTHLAKVSTRTKDLAVSVAALLVAEACNIGLTP